MFRAIALRNFMSFTSIDIDFSPKRGKVSHYGLIYGENGAGKSNIIQSVSFLKESVITLKVPRIFSADYLDKAGINMPSFPDLSDFCKAVKTIGSEENMLVHYEMVIRGKNTIYEMEFSDELLVREELKVPLGKKMGVLYSVEAQRKGPKVSMWEGFITDEEFKNEIKEQILRYWGKHSLLSIMDLQYMKSSQAFMESKVHKIADIIGYLETVHVSVAPIISQVRNDRFPFLVNMEFGTVPKIMENALKVYEKALCRFFRRIYHSVDSVYYDIHPSGDMIDYHLYFRRKIDGKLITVPSVRESTGTRKLISIFGTLIECTSGGIAFIDELDSGVHDKLICDLLAQILSEVDGQLIVTTHNTSLLSIASAKNVLIIDIDPEGHKTVEKISDKGRTQWSNNNRKRYLNNSFGGVPFIGIVDLKGIAAEIKEGLANDV